jgi:hypothetical protein
METTGKKEIEYEAEGRCSYRLVWHKIRKISFIGSNVDHTFYIAKDRRNNSHIMRIKLFPSFSLMISDEEERLNPPTLQALFSIERYFVAIL